MNRDFSQAAASGVAAMQAVRHDKKRFKTGTARRRLFRLQNVRAQNLHDQAAVHA
jgi:hypothetical protein